MCIALSLSTMTRSVDAAYIVHVIVSCKEDRPFILFYISLPFLFLVIIYCYPPTKQLLYKQL